MKADLDYIARRFQFFNAKIFGGCLTVPPMRFSHSRRGIAACRVQRQGADADHCDVKELTFSDLYDLPPEVWDDIIVHEMIHYFIASFALHDTAPHGGLFKGFMRSINAKFGMHISVRYKLGSDDKYVGRNKVHLIFVFTATDGSTYVMSLPRKIDMIVALSHHLATDARFARYEIFVTANPFFDNIPVCRKRLRMVPMAADALDTNLADAIPMTLRDGKLVRKAL